MNDTDSGSRIIKYSAGEHRYRVVLNADSISELYVDGTKIAESGYSNYEPLIKELLDRVEADLRKANLEREKALKQLAEAEVKHKEMIVEREHAETARIQAHQYQKEAELHQEHTEQLAKQKLEHGRQAKLLAESHRVQSGLSLKQGEAQRRQSQLALKQTEAELRQAKINIEQHLAQRQLAVGARQLADAQRRQARLHRARAEKDRKLVEDIISEILIDGLVKNKPALISFELNADDFTVNGIKQSPALHSRYKSKYLEAAGGKISMHKNAGSTTIRID